MKKYQLAEGELKFTELVWQQEPVASGDLVKLCGEAFGWKKSTTYTVLKKLCDRGILQNKNAVVTSILDKKAFYQGQSRQYVKESFNGSLPKFLAAFMGQDKLSPAQAEEIKNMIDAYKEK